MTQQNKLCTVIFIYVFILNPKWGEWDAAADWESTGSCPGTQQGEVTQYAGGSVSAAPELIAPPPPAGVCV